MLMKLTNGRSTSLKRLFTYLFHLNGVGVLRSIFTDLGEGSGISSGFGKDFIDGSVCADAIAKIENLRDDVALLERFCDRHRSILF